MASTEETEQHKRIVAAAEEIYHDQFDHPIDIQVGAIAHMAAFHIKNSTTGTRQVMRREMVENFMELVKNELEYFEGIEAKQQERKDARRTKEPGA